MEKVGLKLNIEKTKIIASGPITSQQIDGETMERVTDFIFLGSKSLWMVTVAMKLRYLLPGRKGYPLQYSDMESMGSRRVRHD